MEPASRGSSFVLSLGPRDISSLQQLVQSAFQWPETEISSNFTTLFPPAAAAAAPPAVPPAFPSPFAAATQPLAAPPAPAVVSPFLGLTPLDLLAAAAATEDAQASQGPRPPPALPVPAVSPGQQDEQEQLWQQQITMQRAQQELLLQQQRRQQQQRQQQQEVAAAAATAAAAAAGQAASTSLSARPGWQRVTTGLPQAPLAAAAAPPGAQAQAQQQQQQQPAVAELEGAGAVQPEKPPPKRRGRPPRADGQYSAAYLALKRYRARRRDQVEEMEATVAAKLAQLAALEQENLSLKHRQEALQATISIQDRMVEQLSALQLSGSLRSSTSEPCSSAAGGGGGPGATAAAGRATGSTPAEQVTALVAALTGERQDNNVDDSDANDVNDGAARDRASPFAGLVNTALNNAGAPSPDWAGITAAAGDSQGGRSSGGPAAAAASSADQAPFQLPPEVQQLHVPTLLARYRAYVAEAAAALTALAAALAAARPGDFPSGQAVPPSAVGRVLPLEAAAQLGVRLPPAPFSLPEFLALGNDERIPPALPAINLLTGQHESIQPEIWRVVAGQISLRPGQRERLAAAWELYSKSLEQVNEERSSLMARLQQALETSDRLSTAAAAAAAAASSGCSIAGGCPGGVPLSHALTDASVVDALLSTGEYYSLSEAIDSNMAREDGIMILFDWAIGSMLDDLQRCQVVVSSWPFFPLMGSICAGLLGVADE